MNLQNFKTYLEVTYTSKKTIKEYYSQIERFFRTTQEINRKSVENYILDLKRRDKGQPSIDLFLSALRKYMEWAEIDVKLPKYKGGRKRKKVHFKLVQSDINKVIQESTKLWPRDYREREFVILLMFYTGMRPSEVLNLKGCDIDFKKKIINIRNGKGGKDRIIPFINQKLVNMLYERRESNLLCELSYNQIKCSMKDIKKFLKIEEHIEPRTLRRSFAKYCFSKGFTLFEVMTMLGHDSMDTTLIYDEPDEQNLIDKCKKLMEG